METSQSLISDLSVVVRFIIGLFYNLIYLFIKKQNVFTQLITHTPTSANVRVAGVCVCVYV
jgi:hypothetical protein